MDKFQATAPDELERLCGMAARHFGTIFLREALRQLKELGSNDVLERFEDQMIDQVERAEGEMVGFNRMKELAIEDLRRAVNDVRRATP